VSFMYVYKHRCVYMHTCIYECRRAVVTRDHALCPLCMCISVDVSICMHVYININARELLSYGIMHFVLHVWGGYDS